VRVHFESNTIGSGYAIPRDENDRIDAVGRSIARRMGGRLLGPGRVSSWVPDGSSMEIEFIVMIGSGGGFRNVRAWI